MTLAHVHEAKSKTSDYWRSPIGMARRIEMLSQNFTYQVVNNSLMFYGYSADITHVRWNTREDERVCIICGPLEGRVYRKGQFLPPLPAHAMCRCAWELIYEPAEIPPALVKKVTGTGFLVDARGWYANLDIIARSAVLLLLFSVADKKQRIKRYTMLQKMLLQQGYNRIEVEARSDEELEFWIRRGFTRMQGDRLYKNLK